MARRRICVSFGPGAAGAGIDVYLGVDPQEVTSARCTVEAIALGLNEIVQNRMVKGSEGKAACWETLESLRGQGERYKSSHIKTAIDL